MYLSEFFSPGQFHAQAGLEIKVGSPFGFPVLMAPIDAEFRQLGSQAIFPNQTPPGAQCTPSFQADPFPTHLSFFSSFVVIFTLFRQSTASSTQPPSTADTRVQVQICHLLLLYSTTSVRSRIFAHKWVHLVSEDTNQVVDPRNCTCQWSIY